MKEFFKSVYFAVEAFALKFKRTRDVLFPVDNELMLTYALQVSRLLEKDRRLRLWFCPHSPGHFRDLGQTVKEHGLRTVPYGLARWLPWDLIVYPCHAPHLRPGRPSIYVGHGLSSGKSVNGKHYVFSNNSTDTEGRVIYDKIFTSSEFLSGQIREHYPEFWPAIRVVGSLLIDEVLSQRPDREDVMRAHGLDPAKKTVMITSSWGPCSLIQSRGEELVKIIPGLCRDYNVVLSLHCNNFSAVHYQGLDMDALLSAVQGRVQGLYVMPPAFSSQDVLPWVDLMVHDMTSLALYFPFFKKPMLYFDHPDLEFTSSGLIAELKKVVPNFRDPQELPRLVADNMSGRLPAGFGRLTEMISSYPRAAGRRYLEEIYGSLGMEMPSDQLEKMKNEHLSVVPKFL